MLSDTWRTEITWLFQAAMLVFVMTVVIGILNGQQIVTPADQAVRLAHVHSGTLGWITLSVLALCLWLFGEGDASKRSRRVICWLSILAAISVPCYVLAFLSGNLVARAVFGTPVLLAIAGWFVWLLARCRQVRLGVAHLALLAAVTTLTIGALLGVLLQFQFASASAFLPAGAFVAHPTALVVGYLVIIGMAISEWKLLPATGRLSRAGLVQISLPFVGGLILTVAALLNLLALFGLSTLCEIAGIGIYLWRVGPHILRTRPLVRGSARHFAISGLFLVVNVLLITYLIVAFLSGAYPSFEAIPLWLIFAFDHGMFIGVLTNALFGLIQDATQERRSFWPWADDVLFWGMNLGLIGFVLSLLSNSRQFEPYVTPIMGGSILVALLTYSIRLLTRKPVLVEAAPGI
jgi:hypothetical protein